MNSAKSLACKVCDATLPENARECPNCGAILSAPVQPASKKKMRYPWRAAARRASQIPAEKEQVSAERSIERKIKSMADALDKDDFSNALKSSQTARKHVPQLKNAKLISALFDLLEQSVGKLIGQKDVSASASSHPVVESKRPRSPSLIGRLALIPLLILAGIGLMGIIKPAKTAEAISPTPTIETVIPSVSPSLAPTVTPGPTPLPETTPIFASNVNKVQDLFNWSAGEDIVSLSFSPNGELIAAGDGAGSIKIFRVWTDEMLFELNGTYAAFSPDGKWLGVAGRSGLFLHNASDGKLVRSFDKDHLYYSVLFSPDSQLIVGGSDNTKFYIWSVNDGAEQKSGGGINGPIHSLSFSQDSRLLAVASNVNTYVWNLQKQKIERSVDFPKQTPVYFSVAVDADGEWFAMGHEDGQMYVWRMSNGERMAIFNDNSRFVHGLQFLQGTNFPEILVSGDEVNLSFWMIQGYEVTSHSIYVSTPILSLTVAPENKLIATGGKDGVIHLWGVLP
jgi:hypothetical protein